MSAAAVVAATVTSGRGDGTPDGGSGGGSSEGGGGGGRGRNGLGQRGGSSGENTEWWIGDSAASVHATSGDAQRGRGDYGVKNMTPLFTTGRTLSCTIWCPRLRGGGSRGGSGHGFAARRLLD